MVAEYFQGYPLYFLDVIAHNLILELGKDLITLYLANRANAKKKKLVAEIKEKKREENVLPTVYSLTVYKICLGLGLEVKLSDEQTRPIWIPKKKLQKEKPVVYSETILKMCEALNIEAQLALSTEREHPPQTYMKETGNNGHIPTVRSFMVFKTCEALGLKVELNTEIECDKFFKKQK
ncbi:hypothetical protein TNIN_139711 [Trichonephila inaurata madagascariensis]|uniref:Uncharacterized protein n=1 Tax=Trichonephila inaurata madagascariensis TaxID=2747483 RepID=A0A8X6XAP4_9ARAC|nr:hypothetical protein TNIN_139711 [Trichonephila inaurata madagascariensis]